MGLYLRIGGIEVTVVGGRGGVHFSVGQRLPKVETTPPLLPGIGQDPEFDLQGGDALARHRSLKAHLLGRGPDAVFRGHPAVAVSQQPDQKGAAALDLLQADLEDQQFLDLLFLQGLGLHPPAQVNGLQVMEAGFKSLF